MEMKVWSPVPNTTVTMITFEDIEDDNIFEEAQEPTTSTTDQWDSSNI